MLGIGYFYHALVGQECSCFPIIKRTVGPGFFVGDGIMLLLALAAFFWSRPVLRFRVPLMALGVFGGVRCRQLRSVGLAASRYPGA